MPLLGREGGRVSINLEDDLGELYSEQQLLLLTSLCSVNIGCAVRLVGCYMITLWCSADRKGAGSSPMRKAASSVKCLQTERSWLSPTPYDYFRRAKEARGAML